MSYKWDNKCNFFIAFFILVCYILFVKKILTNTSLEAYLQTIELIKNRLLGDNAKESNHIIIVPRQFTATVRLGVYTDLNEGTQNIQVTSFEEMAKDYLRNSRFKFLSRESSILLINKSIYELSKQNKIKFFANSHHFENFSELLYTTIRSLVESGITMSDISLIEEKIPEKLKNKLSEIYLIYQKYLDTISENCLDSITVMEALAEELSTGIESTNYYILDFFGFTRQQLKIIKKIEDNALSCTIAFSTTFQQPNSYIYEKKIYDQITKYVEDGKKTGELKSYNEKLPNDIECASNYVFSYEQPEEKNKIETNAIELTQFHDVDAEIINVALDITEGIHNQKRYKDYQILCCDMEKYKYSIKKIFHRYNIPFHLDVKYQLKDQGKIKYLLDALNVINSKFGKEEVINFVNNPLFAPDYYTFTEMTSKPLSKLIGNFEKYVRENYIDGIGNKRSFKMKFLARENASDSEKLMCENAEIVREQLCKVLSCFSVSKQRVSAWIKTLEEFGVISGLNPTWDIYIQEMSKITGEYKRVAEQVDNKLEEIYHLMEELVDYECDLQEFIFLFRGVISAVTIATIPASIDRVHIGSFNSRFVTSEYMYLIGADSNSIPKTTPEGIIITHADEKKLMDAFRGNNNIYLLDAETDMTYNMISIIEFIKKCKKKLVISCSNEESVEPSIIYKQLTTIFNNLEIKKMSESIDSALSFENKSKFALINEETKITLFSENIEEWKSLNKESQDKILQIVGIRRTDFEHIDQLPESIKHEYTLAKKHSFSPTIIERYATCPYMYYISNVLGISSDFDNVDSDKTEHILKGNLSHRYLELFINDYLAGKLTEGNLQNRFNDFYVPEAEKVIPDFLHNVGRFADMMTVTKDAIFDVINEMHKNLLSETSIFKPYKCEASLKDDPDFNIHSLTVGEDENGENVISISGRIDRIDVSKKTYSGNNYYAIYDYKTSNSNRFATNLDPEKILKDGTKIQLPFYMLALENKNFKVGEIAYINVKNDFRTSADSAMEISRIRMDDFYKDTIGNNDEDGKEVICKKDLIDATKKEINTKASAIKKGEIAPTCEQCKNNKYCDFRNVCRYSSLLHKNGVQ